MYHEIGGTPGRDPSLNRTVASFRADLELLHAKGFVPVNLSDVLNDRIDVPAGKSPVVLTFDDGRATQFKLNETADALKVDPNCAVGILEAFAKKYPDWKLRATFFVLPKSKKTIEPFRQVGLGAQKIRYLLEKGMEIGNHSTLHENFSRYTPADIQREVGGAHKALLEAVPEARIESFALPMGRLPREAKNLPYLLKGDYQGVAYEYKAVMLAAWRPIPSPSAVEFDRMHLERIAPTEGVNGLRDWVRKLETGVPYARYVSDGDPGVVSFPKTEEALADGARLQAAGKRANPYDLGVGGAKPIIGG